MKTILVLWFITLVCACGRMPPQAPALPAPECVKLYVLLPANYIIDLEAGSELFLNPSVHEFIVFCKPEDAKTARELAVSQKLLPQSSRWVVYELEGEPAEIAAACHDSALCLRTSAKVIDWISDDESI